MEKLVADKPVSCEVLNLERYERLIATCTLEGRDIGEAMLAIGQAVTYRKYLAGKPVEARCRREPHAAGQLLLGSIGLMTALSNGEFVSHTPSDSGSGDRTMLQDDFRSACFMFEIG